MKPNTDKNHNAAMKKANKAEAKRLAAMLKKLDRDLSADVRAKSAELKRMTIAITRKKRAFGNSIDKATRSTERVKKQIYRRLAILNGRGI